MLTLCIGRRLRGKTTLAYAIAMQTPSRVIFDPRRIFGTTDDIVPDGNNVYEMLDTRSEIIVQPRDYVQQAFDTTANEVSDWIEENPFEDVTLLVDESRFIDTPTIHYQGFDRIIRFSNPEHAHCVMTCHRPGDISTDIRAIADYWCIFHTTQEHDVKAIRERCGNEVAEQLDKLGPKEYILWNDGTGTWTRKNDQSAWFVDIKRKAVVNVS